MQQYSGTASCYVWKGRPLVRFEHLPQLIG